MKKLILSAIMLALIAGGSLTTTVSAGAPNAESASIVATPNIAYCLTNSDKVFNSGLVLAGIGGGGGVGWAIAAGYGLLATVGVGTGVGAAIIVVGA